MSVAAIKKPELLDETATSVLLKEYTEKLAALMREAKECVDGLHRGSSPTFVLRTNQLLDLWQNLRPPAVRLAQYVSSTIEHGRIDQLTELELRLRLAEYEYNLRFTDIFTNTLKTLTNNR